MKTKITRTLTITALLISLIIDSSHGQSFTIESLDGDKQLVQVSKGRYESTLLIAHAKDTIFINGINKIDTIRMLNKNFLMATYHARAGVGIKEVKTLLVSISNNVLRESLHVVSLFKEDFIDFSKPSQKPPVKASVRTIYSTELTLTGSKSTDYKIKATIHDEIKSIREPKGNYNHDLIIYLPFDTSKNIFCSSQEEISPYFVRAYAKIKHSDELIIRGVFPVAKLGKHQSYYQAGKWHDLPDAPE
jgi:hypothetical protein